MGMRQMARGRALQVLYALEFAPKAKTDAEVVELFFVGDAKRKNGWTPFAQELTAAVRRHAADLDKRIQPRLKKWDIARLPAIDRLCLRMALCELMHFPEIPLRVTINECLELSKRFSPDDSHQYINAVLDALSGEWRDKDFKIGPGGAHEALDPDDASEEEDDDE